MFITYHVLVVIVLISEAIAMNKIDQKVPYFLELIFYSRKQTINR